MQVEDGTSDGLSDVLGMVLAAGYGTRLGPLSEERPKPLLPVCDRPLLRWAASLLAHHGVREIAVNLHHLGELLRAALGERLELAPTASRPARSTQIVYSPEAEILGTGGGIREMARLCRRRQTIVVVNGKVVIDLDLAGVVAEHRRRGALATLVVAPHAHAQDWGGIGVDEAGKLARLLDVDSRHGSSGEVGVHLFTGIHVLEPEVVDSLPAAGPCCIVRDGYVPLFAKGAPLFGHVHPSYFYEHSTPERYLQGNLNLLAGRVSPPAAPGPLTGVNAGARIADDAAIVGSVLIGDGVEVGAGATVGPNVVLGAGAKVEAGCHVSDAVIWPGVTVEKPAEAARLHRVIATPRRLLAVPEVDDPMRRPR